MLVSEHLDFAKEKFEEDIAEGMEKMTVKQFREKFREDTAIAALAVIVEKTAGKKRMIHDASHGVRAPQNLLGGLFGGRRHRKPTGTWQINMAI